MKLKKLERRLLRFIDNQYCVAWKEGDRNEMLVIGERRIPTLALIINIFKNHKEEDLKSGVESLVGAQFVKVVKLLNRYDIQDITVSPNTTLRCEVASGGRATIGFQITLDGKAAIEDFWWSKFMRLLGRWGTKFSEDYVPMIFVFILGFLFSALFGIDLKKILGR